MLYSMKQLESITGKAPQTLHRLMRQKKSLIELLPEHRIKLNDGKVFYDEAILEWFNSYFLLENQQTIENAVGADEKIDTENENTETQRPSVNEKIAAMKAEIQAKEEIIESIKQANIALQERIEAQERDIESKTQQIERLIVSNNALSITVNRAQQERMLLEAKKQNLFQRIKTKLLGEKKTEKSQEPGQE